jgi:hypothetical protein
VRSPLAVSAALGCAAALVACGSSSQAQTTSQASTVVKFSDCMRSHGVPSFPDPGTGSGGGNSFGIDGYTFNLPAGLNTRSPAYVSANQACFKLFAGGGGGPHQGSAFLARARAHELAHARCMRAHGVPNFPDPVITSNGGGITVGSGSGGINPRSPAFQHAERICQKAP